MKRLAALASLLFWSTGAFAQETTTTIPAADTSTMATSAQGWSVVSAQTVGEGRSVVHVQAGWPGISGAYLHGLARDFDIGIKGGFFYGLENNTLGTAPGLRVQGVMRWLLSDTKDMKLGFEAEPGIYSYFSGGATLFGILAPLKFTAAFPIMSNLYLHAGGDLPLIINITNGFVFSIPILVGGGAEYFINDSMSVNLRLRFGPSINIGSAATNVTFGFETLAGWAMKL